MTYHGLFAGTEADWIRRAGVLVAIIGTAVAAPDGTAWLWRTAKAMPQRGWSKARGVLAQLFPGLRQENTGGAQLALGKFRLSGRGTVLHGWSKDTPLEERINILRDNLNTVLAEVGDARREALRGVAELRQELEQRLATVEDAHQAHQAAHAITERQAARVDAHGVVLLGLSIVMTGAPDGLAAVAWVGWLFAIGGLAVAIGTAYWAWRFRTTAIQSTS